MRVLILGGSWFVGAAVVSRACSGGHDVTVFNRGRTPASYPPQVRLVRGDREDAADLAGLAGHGPWDAVIDVPGSVPAVVRDSAHALAGVTDRYVFVSTVSVYRDWPSQPITETSPLHPGDPDDGPRERRPGTFIYGRAKAGCELATAREYPAGRTLTLRPNAVLGAGEYVGRLAWWLSRMRRGGRVLAPGRPERTIQPVDVRDLADFTLRLTETGACGAFNVASPEGSRTYRDLLTACASAAGTRPDLTWVDEQWLAEQGVQQWTELPLWRIARGTWAMDTTRALSQGLTCRPLPQTVDDVGSWLETGGQPLHHARQAHHGMDPAKEADLLAAWDALAVRTKA